MRDETAVTKAERAAALSTIANDPDPGVYAPGEREAAVKKAWRRKMLRRLAKSGNGPADRVLTDE